VSQREREMERGRGDERGRAGGGRKMALGSRVPG